MSTELTSREADDQLVRACTDSCRQELMGDVVSTEARFIDNDKPTCVSSSGSKDNVRTCDDNVAKMGIIGTARPKSTVHSGTLDDMAFTDDERRKLSKNKDQRSAISEMDWRPKWLRSEVLAAFTCLFLCLAVAISFTLSYSENKQGVGTARRSFVYVWQFGPTAVKNLKRQFS